MSSSQDHSALESLLSAIDSIAPPPSAPPAPSTNVDAEPSEIYLPHTVIEAIVDSGGDTETDTPAFQTGDTFHVLEHHSNGWIEVIEGGFIWPTWVKVSHQNGDNAASSSTTDSIAAEPSSPLSSDALETRSVISMALRSISENGSEAPSAVATPSRGSLTYTGSCGSQYSLMHESLHDDNAEWREVRLARVDGSFGLQIAGGHGGTGLFVRKCKAGGAAFACKQIRKYDQLIAINGQNLQEASHAEAIDAIKACGDTALFVFRRANRKQTQSHLRSSRSSTTQQDDASKADSSSTPSPAKPARPRSTLGEFLESTTKDAILATHHTADMEELEEASCDEDYEAYEDDSDDSHESRFGFYMVEDEPPLETSSVLSTAAAMSPSVSSVSDRRETSADTITPDSPSTFAPAAEAIPSSPGLASPGSNRRTSDQIAQRLAQHVDQGESRRIEGWLMKQTASKGNGALHKRTWRKRYFILQDTMLKYFKKKPLDGATAAGYVVLHQSSMVTKAGTRGFTIQTHNALFNFLADDEDMAEKWLATLQRVTTRMKKA